VTPGTWASNRQDKNESPIPEFRFLLRRLRHEQANPAQFLVSENDPLPFVVVFDVTQARNARIAAQFGWRHTEKDCRAILINVIKNVSAHVKAQAFAQGRLASATSLRQRYRANEKPNLQLC